MVIANVSNGTTAKFDVADPEQFAALEDLIASGEVSALSILQDSVQHSLPLPRRFRETPVYGAEPVRNGTPQVIGERVFAQVGPIRVSLTATYKSKLVRCDLVRIGRMQYNPAHRRKQ